MWAIHLVGSIIRKTFGSDEPIRCSAPVILPRSRYRAKQTILEPSNYDATITFTFRVVREQGKEDRLEIKCNSSSLRDACERNITQRFSQYPIVMESIEVCGFDNELPFAIPFNLRMVFDGQSKMEICPYKCPKQDSNHTEKKTIMRHHFVQRSFIEAYALVAEELRHFSPVLDTSETFFVIKTDCAFYELVKQQQTHLTSMLYSGVHTKNISIEFNVKNAHSDYDEDGAVCSVRMARSTFDGIMTYLDFIALQHIKYTNIGATVFGVEYDAIGFNSALATQFLDTIQKKQHHQQPSIGNESNNAPTNISIETSDTLICSIHLKCNHYTVYPRKHAPKGSTHMRRIDNSIHIHFPDPDEMTKYMKPPSEMTTDDYLRILSPEHVKEIAQRYQDTKIPRTKPSVIVSPEKKVNDKNPHITQLQQQLDQLHNTPLDGIRPQPVSELISDDTQHLLDPTIDQPNEVIKE
jgi:hypothetical protein